MSGLFGRRDGTQRYHTVLLSLLLTYLIVAILPVLIIGYVSYTNHISHVDEQQRNANMAALTQIERSFGILCDGVKGISMGLISSTNTLKLNKINKRNITAMESIAAIKNMQDELASYIQGNDYVDSIYIYNQDEDMLFTSDDYSIRTSAFYDTEWLTEATMVEGEGRFIDTRIDLDERIRSDGILRGQYECLEITPKNVLSFVKPLQQFMLPYRGYVVINLGVDKLIDPRRSVFSYSRDPVRVLNAAGMIILSNRREEIYRDFERGFPELEQGHAHEVAVFDDRSGDKVLYVAAGENGWTYVLQVTRDGHAYLRGIGRYLIVVAFLLVAGVALSVFFARRFYGKLDGVVSTIKRINRYHKGRTNEFELINETLESMFKESRGLQECLESNVPAIKDNMLRRLLSDRMDRADKNCSRTSHIDLGLNKPYYAAGVLVIHYPESVGVSGKDLRALQKVLVKICESPDGEDIVCHGISLEVGRIGIIVNSERREQISGQAEGVIRAMRGQLGIDAFLVMGDLYERSEDLEQSYSDALELLANNVFQATERVVLFDRVQSRRYRVIRYPFELQEKIIYYLKTADEEQVERHFSLFIEAVYSKGERDKHQIESDCILLISSIMRTAEISGIKLGRAVGIENVYRDFMENDYHLSEIKAWFHGLFTKLIASVFTNREESHRHEELIRDCIAKHYNEELSLEMVAERINLSYSYLRKISRRIFGCSFPHYLNNMRIQKAKEMLKKKDMRISQIVSEVGYNNEQSFFRNFRRITGFTPEEYRRDCLVDIK